MKGAFLERPNRDSSSVPDKRPDQSHSSRITRNQHETYLPPDVVHRVGDGVQYLGGHFRLFSAHHLSPVVANSKIPRATAATCARRFDAEHCVFESGATSRACRGGRNVLEGEVRGDICAGKGGLVFSMEVRETKRRVIKNRLVQEQIFTVLFQGLFYCFSICNQTCIVVARAEFSNYFWYLISFERI